MFYSTDDGPALYVVQVRHGADYREQVGSCEFGDLFGAMECGARLRRWLTHGYAYGLPDEALDLPGELEGMGFDPAACAVEVVRLPAVGPGRYDLAGVVMCEVADPCDDPDDGGDSDVLEPTAVVGCGPATVRL